MPVSLMFLLAAVAVAAFFFARWAFSEGEWIDLGPDPCPDCGCRDIERQGDGWGGSFAVCRKCGRMFNTGRGEPPPPPGVV